jgi:hypothetical protein
MIVIQVLIEAIVVGITTVILGMIIKKLFEQAQYENMMLMLFLTGFVLHITFEIFDLNRWYCQDIFMKTRLKS